MNTDYQYYTVGGFWRNGRPIGGSESGTMAHAVEDAEYFESCGGFPVIYGWHTDPEITDCTEAVELKKY